MRVIHTHRNASADLDGLVWEPVKGGYLSPELSDAAAARYLSIPPAGLFVPYSEPEAAKPQAPGPAEEETRRKAEDEASEASKMLADIEALEAADKASEEAKAPPETASHPTHTKKKPRH